ncbi:hypothetical protein AB0E44_09240 [Micrococcus terreus]|uniref:hypothetical protein n=1 Tax=Micrococcus terreus TaxID=574650 RepID=UPI0033E0D765
MTDPRETLARIRARADAATEGPWEAGPREDGLAEVNTAPAHAPWMTDTTRPVVYEVVNQAFRADAEFIAHARTDIPVMDAALTAALDALDDLDSKHQIHGHECLCGFASARSRSRAEHLTAEVRAAITTALQGETP